jgi:glycosyltransferase involved in cell wall biosynthesis
MPRRPAVSVLLPVYNDRAFVQEAVESILAQTFGDLELLIVDDASDDGSTDYLMSLRDPRVSVFRNDENLGITRTLNRGLGHAKGEYVARMDADDVSVPHRLEVQVKCLEENLDIGIVGSSRILIDEQGAFVAAALATPDDLATRWKCLLGNPFAHSTVVLRRRVLDAHSLRYDESFETAEDYELWSRLMPRTRGLNVSEPLLRYRLRDGGISRSRRAEQIETHDRIAYTTIRRLVPGFKIRPEGVVELRGRYGGASVREIDMDPRDPRWLQCYIDLLEAFLQAHRHEPGADAFRERQMAGLAAAGFAAAG